MIAILNIFNLEKITPLILFLIFLFGGLGLEYDFTLILSTAIFILILAQIYLRKGRINLPKYFKLYALFILILFLHSVFISLEPLVSLKYSLLFASAALVWLLSYNFQKLTRKHYRLTIILLGLVFGLLYFLHKISGTLNASHLSLFLPITNIHPHNHIGDLWAVVMIIVIFGIMHKKSIYLNSIIFAIGVPFLIISQSRSAYMSFVAGLFFVFYKGGYLERYKKFLFLSFLLFLLLFLFSGVSKSIFLNRPYYLQALFGFFDFPTGVGLGNFGYVSSKYNFFGNDGAATYAFNIFFEMLTGVGIFSFVFIYWFYKIFKDIVLKFSERNVIESGVFVGLSVNFIFDFTYLIPGMLWLWFYTLGLMEKKGELFSQNTDK